MKNLSTALLAATIISAGSLATAAAASSDLYTFEYAVVGMGGGKTSSPAYEMVGHIDDVGGLAKSSSQDYSIEPVVGGSDDDGESSVADWAIYF